MGTVKSQDSITYSGDLAAVGTLTIDSTSNFKDAVDCDSTLNVDGIATMQNNIIVKGQGYSEQQTAAAFNANHTITVNWDNGNSIIVDLQDADATVEFTLQNPKAGASYVIQLIQGSVARQVSFTDVLWSYGVTPIITTTNNAIDVITLYYNGTKYLANITQDMK